MSFPERRLRRLRRTPALRRLVAEHRVTVDDLVAPLFVKEGIDAPEPVASMPGVVQHTQESLRKEVRALCDLGIPGVMLFGVPARKDATGTQADAGADVIAPSGMMDGQVGAIRAALDAAGHSGTPILAYAAKYASPSYGPFRDAAECAPQFGDRRGYQMDIANTREALVEVALDVAEGADMVMVKPALAYLDVIAHVRDAFDVPVAAYHVSGEYAMLKAAAQLGWIDGAAVALEHLVAMKRAGADMILTYVAREFAETLQS